MKPTLISTPHKKYSDIATFVAELVNVAGQRLLEDFGQISSRAKGDFDLVTSADIKTETFIKAEIQRRFPTHQIYAEESSQVSPVSLDEFCWIIDPLDGTVNFALGIPFFSVAVALLYEGRPVLSWVYDPIRQELFYAGQDQGSFVNGRQLTIPLDSSAPLPIGGSSGFLKWSIQTGAAASISSMLDRYGKLRILGSQALHLCYVAAGRLRAALSWEGRLWDDAAGALITQEAGGRYTDLWGREVFPLSISSALLAGESLPSLAADPSTHRTILAGLAQAGLGDYEINGKEAGN